MIIAVCLNGYSASFRKTRTATIVERVLNENRSESGYKLMARKSTLLAIHRRRMRSMIRRYNDPENSLLVVCKSYGVKNMVDKVINDIGILNYSRTAFASIDPCWPTRKDLTPNLNRHSLYLRTRFGFAENIYVVGPRDKQLGSQVHYPIAEMGRVVNRQLWFNDGVDHFNVVETEDVEWMIRRAVWYLEDGQYRDSHSSIYYN